MAHCGVLRVVVAAMFAAAALACGSPCGLALHARVTANGSVAPAGGSFFQDVVLKPERGDMEIISPIPRIRRNRVFSTPT
jgi:hypothetical protein